MTEIRQVAITGSEGLIGAAVTRLLEREGIRVTSIDLQTGTDIAEPGIADILQQAAPDAVVHAAAHPGGKSSSEPVEDVRVNALGSMRVFDWCARAKVPILYTSSSAVYGDQPPGPIPETAPLRPGTVYAVAKVACEGWLAVLERSHGLAWTVLRLFATYGAGHKPNTYQGILNLMLTQLLAGNRVVVRGSLDRQRDLLYVDDAAEAIVQALHRPEARGRILNVGTGVTVTVRDLIHTICRVLGRPLEEVEIVEELGTVGDPFNNVADSTQAAAVLGFAPRFMLADGLRALLRERAALSR